MNKRVLLGVGGGLLLVLGLVLGVIVGPSLQALAAGSHPAAAAAVTTTPTNDYCQLYEQTVLKNLPGVSQQELENANKAGAQAVINKLYADGKITQAQQAQADQELSQYANNPCAALAAAAKAKAAGKGATSGATGSGQALSAARSAILAAVAIPLKTNATALQSELASGKTIAQITTAQGVQKAAVDKAYLAAAQAQLAKAVSAGALTQAQSDLAYSYLQQAVTANHYPLLDSGSSGGPMLPTGMLSGMSGQ